MLSKDETVRLAAAYAEQGFLCSESVLLALCKSQNVKSDLVPQIATGFGAGIGRSGEVCGALAGGVMGLGLRFGRSIVDDTQDERRPYWFALELLIQFKSHFGHVRCRELLGLDLSCAEDIRKYREQGLWDTRCREFIVTTTGLAHDLLAGES